MILGLASLALVQLVLPAPRILFWARQSCKPAANAPGCSGWHRLVDEPTLTPQPAVVQRPVSDTTDHQVYLPLASSQSLVTEARALWVTRWNYTTITDVHTLMGHAAGAGFNMALFQVRGAADAFYTPGLEPWAARLSGGTLGEDPGWDPLAAAIEAAHAHGVELHAWLNVYPVWAGATAPPSDAVPQHLFWTLSYDYGWDTWRTTTISGTPTLLRDSGYVWATPALTDVVNRVVSVTQDIVTRYDVDGVHLDIVRYPGPEYSYDPFSNAGFEAARATDETLTWADWQRQQVTDLVKRIYTETVLPHDDLRLSAAVWPIYEDYWDWNYRAGYSDFYQDSQGWMREGAIDTIIPMLYTGVFLSDPTALTSSQFSQTASDFLAHDGGRHVFLGISAEHIDFTDIAERIAIARALGAPGHAIFSAGVLDEKGYWDELAAGPYAAEASIPPMSWRP